MLIYRFKQLNQESWILVKRSLSSLKANQIDHHHHQKPLLDTFGRNHDYLRISLTERCNLRCVYCMPENGIRLTPKSNLLNNEEIFRLASLFVTRFGLKKIRLTGGEPLIRNDIVDIVSNISKLKSNGLEKISMTTNGILLSRYSPMLYQAGLDSVNISLDTLMPERFESITRRNGLSKTIGSIHRALSDGYESVKINCVLIRGMNDDEIYDFIELTKDLNLEVRFIEYMPFDGNRWNRDKMISLHELLKKIQLKYEITRLKPKTLNDTAILYQVKNYSGTLGFINSMTNTFCSSCNRIRLTADGHLKVCLFGREEISLKNLIRDNNYDDDSIETIIRSAVKRKKKQHSGAVNIASDKNRPMILIDQRKFFSTTNNFTHIDEINDGQVKMVNVGEKISTKRQARARSIIELNDNIMKKIENNQIIKGNVLTIAKIAGIMAAKSTSNLIPLCHHCPLDNVDIEFQFDYQNKQIIIESVCETNWKTGVEIEALMAATIASLTIYDMCKSLSKSISIKNCSLIYKSGGKSGVFINDKNLKQK